MERVQYYPPPPWKLRGEALLRLQLIALDVARPLVPKALRLVPVMPGRTVAALYLARYQAGSTLEYHELIVVPALVQRGAKVGGWVSHIYVDSAASQAGGQAVWALPKQMAQFQWESCGSHCAVEVEKEGQTLCHVRAYDRGLGMTIPLVAPVVSCTHERLLSFHGVGSSRVSSGRGKVCIPTNSPLANLGFASGRLLLLDQLNLNMKAPRC